MISWLSILPCITLAFGVVLLARGLRGVRTGERPHCANCDFDLTGLDPPTPGITRRCPECGSVLGSPRATIRGDRKPQRTALFSGLILLAATASVPAAVLSGRQVNWRAAVPTGILIGWVGSPDNDDAHAAATELLRRHTESPLPQSDLRAIVDACLARPGSLPGPNATLLWSVLLDAAYEAGAVDDARREAHLRRILAPDDRTLERLNPIALSGLAAPAEPPSPGGALLLTPILDFDRSWARPRQSFGVIAALHEASLDGQPLPLVTEAAGPNTRAPWVRYGAISGASTIAPPMPLPRLEPLYPEPGPHRLDLTWRLDIYDITEKDADTTPQTRPPDHALEVSLTHEFRVVGSIEEVVRILHADDPGAPPPPALILDPPALAVTARRPLADGSGWLYEVTATPARDPRQAAPEYALLGIAHLRIGPDRFDSQDPGALLSPDADDRRTRWSSPRFYDPAPSAPPARSRRFSGAPRPVVMHLVNLPHADRADLVITPTPGFVLERFGTLPEQAYWGDSIVLPGVPIDWSALAEIEPDLPARPTNR